MAGIADSTNIPAHIAIIMDGNGRWAKKRMLPHSAGHKAGSENLKAIAESAEKLGVKHMTVFAFSTENWGRSKDEVDYLMGLMDEFLTENLEKSKNNNYRIKVIGQRERLRPDLTEKINRLEKNTIDKTGMTLIIAISYGGKDEIVRAVREISRQCMKGAVEPDNIDESLIQRYMDTKDIPDPDLLIRTSGEMRISNFLIWQIAYSEIYISRKLWPDFSKEDLKEAINDYQSRERRYGGRLS